MKTGKINKLAAIILFSLALLFCLTPLAPAADQTVTISQSDSVAEIQQKVYALTSGVITKIERVLVWDTPNYRYMPHYQYITIYNSEGNEVSYIFSADFCNAYNAYLDGFIAEGASFLWDSSTVAADWGAVAGAGPGQPNIGEVISAGGFAEGDLVELILDQNKMIAGIANYAAFENDGKINITGQSDRNRITIEGGVHSTNGVFPLTANTVIFNVTTDNGNYTGVNIISAAQIQAGDFTAAKAVTFFAEALYFIDVAPVIMVGVVTREGQDNNLGDFYRINNIVMAGDGTRLNWTPALISYTINEGKVTIVDYLTDKNGQTALLTGDTIGDYSVAVGIETNFNSATKSVIINDKLRLYLTDSSYVYNLIENEEIEDYRTLNGANVIAFYDNDYDLALVAIVDLKAATFNGAVLYQASTCQATVALYGKDGNLLASTTTAANGAYTLSAGAGAGYTLVVSKPGYLSYTVKNLTLTAGESIQSIDLRQLAGDIDGDGVVNATDLTYLLSEFNRNPADSLYPYADIDGNGIVNATDLTYLLAGFNKHDVEITL